jgi:hypothetical protein
MKWTKWKVATLQRRNPYVAQKFTPQRHHKIRQNTNKTDIKQKKYIIVMKQPEEIFF